MGYADGGNLFRYCDDQPAVYVDPSGLCRVCGSGIRYRVSIASLDTHQVGTPYQDMADFGINVLRANPEYVPRRMVAPFRTEAGPFKFANTAFGAEGMSFPAGTWVAGHFLFFVDWEICEEAGACGLRAKETLRFQREGGDPQSKDVPWKTPSLGNGWTKALRKRPVGGCNKTLIYADAPGWFAQTRPVQNTPAAGVNLTVDETLEVFNVRTGDIVDTQQVHVEISIDRAGNLSASP